MNINNLKVGDKVFIKNNLECGRYYGLTSFENKMVKGWCEVIKVDPFKGVFCVKTNRGNEWEHLYNYTPDMVDWEKTRGEKKMSDRVAIRRGIFREITQVGGHKGEITKGITYEGEKFIAKNNGETNDPEKAVMLLMLKQLGVTYKDIKREAEKVITRWKPGEGELYYYMNGFLTVRRENWCGSIFDKARFRDGNCFKTPGEANEKRRRIRNILLEVQND